MAIFITRQCVSCGNCKAVCPRGAVVEDLLGYQILADRCDECRVCMDVCPVDCIRARAPKERRANASGSSTYRFTEDKRDARIP